MKNNKDHPKIQFSQNALQQWQLIVENDFSIGENKYLRIQIDGKGCNGFTYAVGMSAEREQDKIFEISPGFSLLMDSFTAFYAKNIFVDYVQDFKNNEEGFIVHNYDEKKYYGKFWKDSSDNVPNL